MEKKITPRGWMITVVVLVGIAIAILSYKAAAAGVFVVSGNTAAGENQAGWLFNRALTEPTPYSFTFNARTMGLGSLYIGPAANANDKFVAELFPGQPLVADFRSFSYDAMLGQGGQAEDVGQFMVSIYANIDMSTNSHDCRYDYTALTVTHTNFTKHVVYPGIAPKNINKGSDRLTDCPATLDGMPAGSHIRAIAISMGDTGIDDTGLDAYIDNVELVLGSDATTFDFEPAPMSRADCDGKKWQQFNFRNQGQCIKYVDKGIDTR